MKNKVCDCGFYPVKNNIDCTCTPMSKPCTCGETMLLVEDDNNNESYLCYYCGKEENL